MANHGANPANVERVANPIYSTTANFKRIAAEELRCGVRTFPHLVDDPDVDFEPNDTVAYEREALP